MKLTKNEYIQGWYDTLFPLNKDVWLKIKTINQTKCFKLFSLAKSDEDNKNDGFIVSALDYKEDEPPQVAALIDLKSQILMMDLPEYELDIITNKFNSKIAELKQNYIIEI